MNYRYGADKLQKGPKVQLDRNVVEKYFQEDDSEEERRKEVELERKRKKAAYYNKMNNRKWKSQKQIFVSASASSNDGLQFKSRKSQSPKKFKCDVCSKPFAYPGALRKHKKREHGQTRGGRYTTAIPAETHQQRKAHSVSRNYSSPMARKEENGFDKEVVLLDTDGKSSFLNHELLFISMK